MKNSFDGGGGILASFSAVSKTSVAMLLGEGFEKHTCAIAGGGPLKTCLCYCWGKAFKNIPMLLLGEGFEKHAHAIAGGGL